MAARRAGTIDDSPVNQAKFALVDGLDAVARQAGLSLTHMSLTFVAEHPAITSVIIGPKTIDQLDDLLGAADVRLDRDTLDAIDTVAPPGVDAPGTGHDMGDPSLRPDRRRRPVGT